MKLSGSATIGHPVHDVYAALTDPAILVRTLPGCQRLELVGPDAYQATMSVGVGSIKGLFDGGVRLTDQSAPDSFILHASGAGVPGTVDAVAHVRLVASPSGETLVHYAADATVGGVIGGVGQRMLAGVARRTAGEFFAAVDRELSSALVPVAGVGVTASAGADVTAGAGAGVDVTAGVDEGALADIAPAPAGEERAVWTRPAPAPDPSRQRVRELIFAASFGAVIALLGVLIGALVAGW